MVVDVDLVVVVVAFVVGAGDAEVIFTGEGGAATPWVTEDADAGDSVGDEVAVVCETTGAGSGPIGTWVTVCTGPVVAPRGSGPGRTGPVDGTVTDGDTAGFGPSKLAA